MKALAKSKELTRAQISDKAPVDNAMCTSYIGSLNPEIREKTDKTTKSLLTWKYVAVNQYPDKDGKNGPPMFSITAAGKKALTSM